MDPVYQSVLDPIAALAYTAAVTSTIRLGVAVINVPFVSLGYLAKQAASVDVLSSGRLDLGLGLGWMPEEFTVTGGSMERRGARTTECVRALRTLWADQPAEFIGDFYQVPCGSMLPRPVQPGGPPILLGGLAPAALRRVGRIADGWVTSSRADLSQIGSDIAIIKEAAAAAGRDPQALRVICRGVLRPGDPVSDGKGGRLALSGSHAQIEADVEELAGHGVTEIFYDLNWDPQVGSPDTDPALAAERAESILAAFAPAASGR
jgi:probable F420-dependent oxidoreductase